MLVLLRGGGDLASGVALRLVRSGIPVVITELQEPLAIRRRVSFAEAVFEGQTTIEGITSYRIDDPVDTKSIHHIVSQGGIPVVIDPLAAALYSLQPAILVDARMLKQTVEKPALPIPLVVGLGPGFQAGLNCHAVVETQRGHTLGRVYWEGSGLPDDGTPDGVMGITTNRVIRSPVSGLFQGLAEIGDQLVEGQPVAKVSSHMIRAPFRGVLRGLLHSGLLISKGMKVGDIDPRNDPRLSTLISDKALAVGGGVLEAILTQADIRKTLWD